MTDPLLAFALGLTTGALLVATGYWTAEAVRQWRHRERCRRRRATTPVVRPAEWQPGSFTFPGVFEPALPRESMPSIPDALTAQSPKETL